MKTTLVMSLFALGTGLGPCSKAGPPSDTSGTTTTTSAVDPVSTASAVTPLAPSAHATSAGKGATHAQGTTARRPVSRPAAPAAPPPKIQSGPPRMSGGKVYSCAAKTDCFGVETCTAQHTCVCDASSGWSRCEAQGACNSLLTDSDNCGECGHSCGLSGECTQGHCGSLSCSGGETKCHLGTGADYCANLKESNSDCGACDHGCAAFLVCVGGHCKKEE